VIASKRAPYCKPSAKLRSWAREAIVVATAAPLFDQFRRSAPKHAEDAAVVMLARIS
jgi:hypothetical protein